MEKTFSDTVYNGNVEVVKEILRNNPNLDVDWRNEYHDAAMNAACGLAETPLSPSSWLIPTSMSTGETMRVRLLSSLPVALDTPPVFVSCWGIPGSR